MSVMYVALPVAIALGAAAMWACVRSIRSGQFDDLDSPAVRMLIDDPPQRGSDSHSSGSTPAAPPKSDAPAIDTDADRS